MNSASLPQTMNDLALLAIGIGGGLCLALVVVMVYVLWSSARQMQRSLDVFLRTVPSLRDSISSSIDKLRGDVNLALSRMDAERLYTASLQIQRSAKLFSQQIDQLQRVVFSQPSSPAIDFTPAGAGMETEAEDDERALKGASRRSWQDAAEQAGLGAYQPADPLASLSEEAKRQRVNEFFERRRQQAQSGYQPDVYSSSTPPAAGSGVYSSLLEEVTQRQPAPPPPPQPADFSGLELEEGAELSEKGELG